MAKKVVKKWRLPANWRQKIEFVEHYYDEKGRRCVVWVV
jgi:hypothetical protein